MRKSILAASALAGADLARAALSLSQLEPAAGRGVRRLLEVPGGEALLIDESYNANPASMSAALNVLGQASVGPNGRRIAMYPLANYQETVAYYAKADRVRLVFPSPFFRNMPTGIIVESMEQGKAVEKRVTASLKEAFKEELIHFAECVRTGARPITTPEEARGDVALLHEIFHAIKRPLAA